MPPLFPGFGVTMCGYCGFPLKIQMTTKGRKSNGIPSDGYGHLQCVRVNSGSSCAVESTCLVASIECVLIAIAPTW